jgi:hypothetical protein
MHIVSSIKNTCIYAESATMVREGASDVLVLTFFFCKKEVVIPLATMRLVDMLMITLRFLLKRVSERVSFIFI